MNEVKQSSVLDAESINEITRSLDLGCGEKPRNPMDCNEVWGLDIRDLGNKFIKKADVVLEPIPFETDFFDTISAFDFIEHIPRVIYAPDLKFPFVELMNEIHRCLKPGGSFISFTPCFPSPVAFQDPTHVNIITENTFSHYFCEPRVWGYMYGFKGRFELVNQCWSTNKTHLISHMKKY
jgi:SAM-dependent methyltransferase